MFLNLSTIVRRDFDHNEKVFFFLEEKVCLN